MRRPLPLTLGPLLALALSSCYSHKNADELVERVPSSDEDAATVEPSEEEEPAQPTVDAGRPQTLDAGTAMSCNQSDIAERLLCTAGLGGLGIEGIVNGILGGGMQDMNCARETDPLALLLCTAIGGSGGLEGIVNGLLGDAGIGSIGAILTDGGVERVVTNVLVEVVRGLIDDLLDALFGGFADAGAARPRDAGARGNRALLASAKGRDLVRSAQACAAPAADDLVTRLVCLRQALDRVPVE